MAQVNATYSLEVDLDADLTYDGGTEDISAYWKTITVEYGMGQAGDHMGRSATMSVRLENSSHKFSPQHASALSGFTVGRKIRLRMTYSATTVTLYEGRIDDIMPQPGANGSRECMVRCNGFIRRLQRDEVSIPNTPNSNTGDVIASILTAIHEYPAPLTGWFLGNSTWSILESTTTLRDVTSYTDIEDGKNEFVVGGDNFQERASPYGAIRDLVESERGWFFEDRDANLVYWNRHHLQQDLSTAVDGTLTDSDFTPLRYSFGGTLTNSVDVDYRPRVLDGVGVVLGVIDTPVRVKAGASTTVTVRFVDDSGQKVNGINLITPVGGVDFTANRQLRPDAPDMTKYVFASVKALGDRADITFTNKGAALAYVIKGARIRGTRVIDFGPQKVHYQNDTYIASYGREYKALTARLLEDADTADGIARWEVGTHGAPTGNLEQIAFYANKNNALMVHARDRDVGDRVALSETQTGASDGYFIMGKRVSLTPPNIHYETWVLEPEPSLAYWLLGSAGFSEVGATTTIGV